MEMKRIQMSNSSSSSSSQATQKEIYRVIHKVPSGDSPYVKAKHAQLLKKDPEGAIVWFWKAIHAGDRVESALKDMAVVMKQLDRPEEAIEAIKSFRSLCPKHSQDSLDNVLIDLYKKCGKVEEQIDLIKLKLRLIYQGEVFNGKPTKTARSHGKKFQVSVKQETTRLLGNLGWAYMQKQNYKAAEVVYRKAQMIDPDANKACNLAYSLMKQARFSEAHTILESVLKNRLSDSQDYKPVRRAEELMIELESRESPMSLVLGLGLGLEDEFVTGLEQFMNEWTPSRTKRLPIFEAISKYRDEVDC